MRVRMIKHVTNRERSAAVSKTSRSVSASWWREGSSQALRLVFDTAALQLSAVKVALLASILLAGCKVGPDYKRPEATTIPSDQRCRY